MTNRDDRSVVLRLEGERATHGVNVTDLVKFFQSFNAALRDYDRERRGEVPRKTGHPESRAEAVTAFRLVRFAPGSGIATIEPSPVDLNEDSLFEETPAALENLCAMADALETDVPMSKAVSESLVNACKTLGPHGSLTIEFSPRTRRKSTRIDVDDAMGRLKTIVNVAESVGMISGRLHLIDLEPDKVAIRDASGIDWSCTYPENVEELIRGLVGHLVVAHGEGALLSPQRGRMEIERIESPELHEQSALFTEISVDDVDLLMSQGFSSPQGLEQLGEPEWDDETDLAYLEALND